MSPVLGDIEVEPYVNITESPYNARSDAEAYYDLNFSSGQSSITVPGGVFGASYTGKTVLVTGVGAANAPHVTTVAAGSSGTTLNLTDATAAASPGTGSAVVIGTDCTAAIQSAVDALAAANGGTIFFPHGNYLLTAAPTTGSVSGTGTNTGQTFNYSGQVNFPARPQASSVLTIRLLGETPLGGAQWAQVSNQAPSPSGSILCSSTSSGSVFDAISDPAGNPVGGPHTAIQGVFESIAVRTPPRGNAGGIIGKALASLVMRDSNIDVLGKIAGPGNVGTGIALWMPYEANSAILTFDTVQIQGYGTGIVLGEHATLTGVIVQACDVGLTGDGQGNQGHIIRLVNVCVQNCNTVLSATAGSFKIVGEISHESNTVLVADTGGGGSGGGISGELYFNGALSTGVTVRGQPYKLNMRTVTAPVGYMNQPVYDTFVRTSPSTTYLDATDKSNHWYKPFDGLVAGIVSNKAAPSSGFGALGCPIPKTWRSFAVSGQIQLGTTKACLGWAVKALASGSDYIGAVIKVGVAGTPNQVLITKKSGSYATLATSSTLALTLGSTYEFAVMWDQPIPGGPVTIRAYVDGVEAVTYALTSGERTTFAANDYAGLLFDVPASSADDKSSRWLNMAIDRV